MSERSLVEKVMRLEAEKAALREAIQISRQYISNGCHIVQAMDVMGRVLKETADE